ncbi:MAG: hypothetical protein IT428_12470 [Planctomycetaceae bacterium]|nr:hypothetical protein [Planctomycetaceae bacterium]
MNFSVQWFPLLPVPVILLTGAGLAGLLAFGTLMLRKKGVPLGSAALLAVLRGAMIVVFMAGLLRPVVSVPRTTTLAPDALVLVDASASMGQPAGANSTRWAEARRTLESSPALTAAAKTHKLHWFQFDRRATSLDSAAALQGVNAEGDRTDVASSLESAFQHVRLQNAAAGRDSLPTRVLLVSDGLDQGSRSAAQAAHELGLVIDVLAPAAESGASDAAARIVDIQGASRVLLGSETALQVTVRAAAASEGMMLVVEEEGREVARRDLGKLSPGQETRVAIDQKPTEAGLKRYKAKLVRGDAAVGPARAINVQVTDRRHDVLMLEDSWRWDFKYLKRVFEDDPTFTFTAMLSRGNGIYVQFGEPDRRVQLGGFPRSRAELDGFETIILGNCDPQTWPRGTARNLAAAVSEGGKSLIVLGGPHLAKWVDVAELAQLLPVEIARETGTPVSGKMELKLTPEGAATSWFTVGPNRPAAEAGSSSALPDVEHVYPAVRKRPAATVLVETAAQSNSYGPLAVIAEHSYGRGHVLFIGTDTLWHWQTLGPRDDMGVTLYTSFWQQALRGMAPPEPTAADVQLWLRPERTIYRTTDRVRLTAELQTRAHETRKAERPVEVTSTVVLPDGKRLPLDLLADPRDPSRRTAWFDATQSGRYRIEAAARNESNAVSDVATVIEVVPRAGERDPAPVDVAYLARLASETGGRVVDPQAEDGWLKPEAASTVKTVRAQSFDLWHNFTMLLALCVLLAADWTLRLFRGFV